MFIVTDLLNDVFQSSVWQTGVPSLYSCGGLQHCPFLTLSMPSGKELTASFSLQTPLIYLPNEQFAHPGRLRADSHPISLHLSFPVINRRQSYKLVLGCWGWVCDYAKMLYSVDFDEEFITIFENVWSQPQISLIHLILDT